MIGYIYIGVDLNTSFGVNDSFLCLGGIVGPPKARVSCLERRVAVGSAVDEAGLRAANSFVSLCSDAYVIDPSTNRDKATEST